MNNILHYDLTNDEKTTLKNMSRNEIHNRFRLACINGELEVIRYLLTSIDLRNKVDIHFSDNFALKLACHKEHISLLQYLLTSPELNGNADIHANNNEILKNCCRDGKLKTIQYLLTNPSVKEKIDIHEDDDEYFISSDIYNREEIVQYLIFDFNIKKTPTIELYIKEHKRENLGQMFEKRELQKKLQKDLNNDRISIITVKL